MASLFGIKIENLRKRSRVLLTCLEENARVVRKEVKKLRKPSVKNSSSESYYKKRKFIYERNSDIWKIRNDSSGVGAALCSGYFRPSPKYESKSDPNMNGNRRLLMKTDRKYSKSSPQRRGIKECYCYTSLPDTRKNIQRSNRTKHKHSARNFREINPDHCGDDGTAVSGPDLARILNTEDLLSERRENVGNNLGSEDSSPPLSAATLIRAQRINYTPRSKFLRKVQSKVNSLRSSSPESPNRVTARSPSRNIEAGTDEFENNTEIKKGGEFRRKQNCRCIDNEEINNPCKVPKKTLLPKITIVSKKSGNDYQKSNHPSRNTGRSPPPRQRVVRVMAKDDYNKSKEKMRDHNFGQSLPRDYERTYPCSDFCRVEKRSAKETAADDKFDSDINNVRKFRDKNYFDTHASNPSLLGSRSSGSMQQYFLNERLFPEPIGKIHRDNILVSIPPCATRQKKTIHYFPRNVIKQEKNISNINYTKKRRCPSCPLIGHAVDLGALKVSHPTNSLALRYQKGIP